MNEAQESFTDAHVRAFERFGGVPCRVRYDNLKTAVAKVLTGRDRTENEHFIALRSHYGFVVLLRARYRGRAREGRR